jgi:two-component system cell cycle sensor histidine kinase/response regulator CckA
MESPAVPWTQRANPPDPPSNFRSRFAPYLWAILAVGLGVGIRIALGGILGTELPFVTLFPAVFVTAYLGGFRPTLLATILSIIAALFLFIEPVYAFGRTSAAASLGVFLFALSGLAAGWLGESRLRAHQRAQEAARIAEREAARAEQEALNAEEESARAEEEMLRAEEQRARAELEAERAARESERIDRILASITDAFMVLDRNWNITYMNESAAKISGGRPSDFLGRNLWEAFPESVGSPFDKAYRQALAERRAVMVEAYYQPFDKWFQVTAFPWAEGLTVVSQDVSARVRAHEATTRLAAIITSSADAIIGKTLDGTITNWNPAAERIFGYSEAEMVGGSIYTLIPPELHDSERDVLRRIALAQSVELKEVERIRKDGQRVYVSVSVSPIKDQDGRVVGAASIKRDVTAERQTQAALDAAAARSRELAQALDATQAVICDLDGRVTYWSSGSAQLLGWSAQEARDRVLHDLLQTEFPTPLEEIRATLLAHGRWEGELVHTAKDGRRVHTATQWILRRGPAEEPLAVIQVSTDVTARRLVEERVRQTDRMEVIGQLAGGMAHETNNQMTVVLGAASFLLGREDLPPAARRDLEYIREAAERTAAIMGQLLAFSRRQLVQARVLDLDETVEGLENVLRRALGERSTLVLQLRAKGRVKADPGQLTQVLLNLILNARDAMALGGRVTIETWVTELTEAYARQRPGVVIHPGHYAVLAVSDTGHGMGPETMAHLFEPFYTTKPMGKGTGLGLATVYGIVKQSGGYVWAYSELGRGTTFKLYLPLDPESVAVEPVPPQPVRSKGETVLLVEDEPGVRQMASRALQEYGYGVVEASGGHQALAVIERENETIDLLITDVVLAGMDGPGLARRASQLRPELPVLFISGYTDLDVSRRGLVEAGLPFLQKPFTPEALVAEAAEVLRRARGVAGRAESQPAQA